MTVAAAARVDDPFGHSSAWNGVLVGLAVGALIGTAILTGGVSLIAVGAAVAITGSAGLAGEAIGRTIDGPETGQIRIGSPDVFTNRKAAAMTVVAKGLCDQDSGSPIPVATGAATVLINGRPAARVGERMACSAVIRAGSTNVFIGGPSVQSIRPTPEVPALLDHVMLAMVIGGTAIGTLGVGLAYGAGAAVGSLVGGVGGSYLGGHGASAAAAAMDFGATGQAIAGVAGGFAGGALGGGLGLRGGQAGEGLLRTGAPEIAADAGAAPFTPKKAGQIEPGAVPSTPALEAEMASAGQRQSLSARNFPDVPASEAGDYPDLPASEAKNFGDNVRPWSGDDHPGGTIRRVVGADNNPNGPYWQADVPPTEAAWRGGAAVKNDWNGNGAYVESPSKGLRGWIGEAAPQRSSDGSSVLPGRAEQIWIEPGSASPGPPIATPWTKGS